VRFSHHEDGAAADEDLVGQRLADTGPAELVEDGQQRGGACGGVLGQAAESGHAGGLLTEQDGQEASGDGEADALGLGGSGELGLSVVVEEDGLVQASLQVVAAILELLALLA